MRGLTRKIGHLSAVTVGSALAVLALAPTAQARTFRATCTLDGKATASPPVPDLGGTGTYSFAPDAGGTSLTFDCIVRHDNDSDHERLQMTSGGSYANDMCGTSSFTSTDTHGGTISDPIVRLAGTKDLRDDWWNGSTTHTLSNQVDLSYGASFTAGQGQLVFFTGGGGPVWMSPAGAGCGPQFQWHGVVNL